MEFRPNGLDSFDVRARTYTVVHEHDRTVLSTSFIPFITSLEWKSFVIQDENI